MKKSIGIGGHQSATIRTDEWLSPPEIIHSLGSFDLDPCAPIKRPWNMAAKHFTIMDDGLIQNWGNDRIWMNPPYGLYTERWLAKLKGQGNSIALTFARTETDMFVRHAWKGANSIFFFYGRLHFYTVEGVRAKANAGGPSCLITYGMNNVEAVEKCGLKGKHIILKTN